jgi:hypothetical protein
MQTTTHIYTFLHSEAGQKYCNTKPVKDTFRSQIFVIFENDCKKIKLALFQKMRAGHALGMVPAMSFR